MLLRLQNYNLPVTYTKGSELYIAETLSKAFVTDTESIFNAFSQQISQINQSEWIPKISHSRFRQIREKTNCDPVLQILKTIGWNDHQDDIPEAVRDYWNTRNELSARDGLIYKSNRVVIQKLHLQKISEGVYYISSKTDTYLESNFRLAKHSYKVYELQSRPKTDV